MALASPLANAWACAAAALVLVVAADRVWQQHHTRWTNEPPMLPYSIPFVGHAIAFGKNPQGVIQAGAKRFLNRPYSLLLFGKHVYIFTSPKDANAVYRKSKALAFLPLVESLVGPAWGITPDGVERLGRLDQDGDSLFRNAHSFYRDSLKEGSQLEVMTLKFLRCAREALEQWFEKNFGETNVPSLRAWSREILGTSSTNAVMGPSLLQSHPNLLQSVWLVERGFFFFVNRIPRFLARKQYEARDTVMDAFAEYLADDTNRKDGAPMIWERDDQMREKGMQLQDRACYSYSAYAACVVHMLQVNSIPNSYLLLWHIFSNRRLLDRIREELAPVFSGDPYITGLAQVVQLRRTCPLLRACFDETLRLHASSTSNRRVVEETDVSGFTLKAGRHVILPAFAHHQSDVFGAHPAEFRPERFLPGGEADPKQVRAFGGGATMCSGRYFATNEVLSYAATVVWKCNVEMMDGLVKISERKLEPTT